VVVARLMALTSVRSRCCSLASHSVSSCWFMAHFSQLVFQVCCSSTRFQSATWRNWTALFSYVMQVIWCPSFSAWSLSQEVMVVQTSVVNF